MCLLAADNPPTGDILVVVRPQKPETGVTMYIRVYERIRLDVSLIFVHGYSVEKIELIYIGLLVETSPVAENNHKEPRHQTPSNWLIVISAAVVTTPDSLMMPDSLQTINQRNINLCSRDKPLIFFNFRCVMLCHSMDKIANSSL